MEDIAEEAYDKNEIRNPKVKKLPKVTVDEIPTTPPATDNKDDNIVNVCNIQLNTCLYDAKYGCCLSQEFHI